MSSAHHQVTWQPSSSHAPPDSQRLANDTANLAISDDLQPSSNVVNNSRPQGLSIRDIRMSMNNGQGPPQVKHPSPPESLMPNSIRTPSQVPVKKKSLFGGLFAVREPTQVALDQFAAQLGAQHGSISARQVPNVRMEKMPQHVPKVNSKWDGIPDAIKQREKREKELAKAAKRQSMTTSMTTSTIRSHSSEGFGRPSESRHSNISDLSGDSRGHSRREDSSRNPNPHRFYAQSVNSSGDLAAQLREESDCQSTSDSHPPSTQTASSKSTSEKATHKDDPAVKGHSRKSSSKGSRGQVSRTSEKKAGTSVSSRPKTAENLQQPRPKAVQRIMSDEDVVLLSSGHGVLPLPSPSQAKQPMKPNAAFLAGEAQEFQIPDDASESDASELHGAPHSPAARPQVGPRRTTDDDRPASANDFHNAQLRPKSTVTGRLGSLLKREP
jgi:hypothetical protein